MKQLFSFLSVLFLLSFNSYSCQKDYKIIEATYYNWFGGVKGVRGKVFVISLSKNSTQDLEINNLIINGKVFPVEKVIHNNSIEVSCRISEGDNKEVEIKNPIENNTFYIEYTNLTNKKAKKLKVKTFKYFKKIIKEEKVS